jgi:hypothetical protein
MAQHPDKPEHVSGRPVQGEPSASAASSPIAEPGLRVPVQKRIDLRLPWWQYPITLMLFVAILVLLVSAGLAEMFSITMAKGSGNSTVTAWKGAQLTTKPDVTETIKTEKTPWQVGRWTLKDDKGEVWGRFNLRDDKTATKDRVPDATGTWEIVGNECRITWSDGWKYILRPQPVGVTSLTFRPGTSWCGDEPSSIQHATKEPLK